MNPVSPASDESVSIERMTEKEVEVAVEWAQKEGWNPGIHDAQCFFHADPKGFFAAKVAGEIVGTVSAVKYSEDFAFEGFLIVKPQFRGKGLGFRLQDFVNNLYGNINIGLDGVLAMQQKYERGGFKFAHKNTRYAGIAGGTSSRGCCLPIRRADFVEVSAFDSRFFAAPRPSFLENWLFQKDATALLVREKQTNSLSGYGVIRKCMSGHKIGPLFAEDADVAEALFEELTATVQQGEEVFLDVPEPNEAAVRLAQQHGMQPVFHTVRMYTNQEPRLPLEKIFGVTSFELG
ncbi:MAG: GNAT family N-acetyltransferase [Candidatus Bathyarchaeota archaeon]|nr:GNAT family N-acetyltransferase [Candidatus Bathyarchaeota archaeon]